MKDVIYAFTFALMHTWTLRHSYYDGGKIGVQKCTAKLRTPVTPIVGRTSEECHKRLHVCVYAHMDAATLTAWCGKIWCAEMRVKTDDPCDTNSFV